MRRAAVAGVVLLALAAGILLWGRRPARTDRTAPTTGAPQAAAPSTAGEPVGAEGASESAEGDAGEEAEWVVVRGTVHVVEEDGRLLAQESGSLEIAAFHFMSDEPAKVETVEVARGKWVATAPRDGGLSFGDVVLGGRKAVPLEPDWNVPEDGPVEVSCRWFVPTRLRVVGEKGEDLKDIELVADDAPRGEIVPEPEITEADLDLVMIPGGFGGSSVGPRFRLGPSPVELPDDEGTVTYWVRARDHAWSRITVALGFGGERVVRLVRAGTLDVRLTPVHPDALIDLCRFGEEVLEWRPDESGFARIEGLPPGRFEVRACIGEWQGEAAEVQVEAGKTREVFLPIDGAPPATDYVRLAGTLVVDPAWPAPEGWVRIDVDGYSGPAAMVDGDGRWSVDLVAPGRHTLTVEPWMWTQVVEVGPDGNTEARIVVPPPCDVEVHLVDAETGEAIASENRISWRVASEPGLEHHGGEKSEEPGERGGIYRFRAPLGTLTVGLWSDLLGARETETELKPGKNLVRLKAAWNLGFDLALRDGAMPVPVDAAFSDAVRAEAIEGEGALEVCGDGDPCRVWVTKPGRYRVSFPVVIEGYEPIAPVEVDAAPGRIPRVEIPLRRRDR